MERTEDTTIITEEEPQNDIIIAPEQEPEPTPVAKPKVKRERTAAQIENWKKLCEKRDLLNAKLKEEKKIRKALKKPQWKMEQDVLLQKITALEERITTMSVSKEQEPEPVPEPVPEPIPEPPPVQRMRYYNPTDRLTLFSHLL